jgi:hypothetical protein
MVTPLAIGDDCGVGIVGHLAANDATGANGREPVANVGGTFATLRLCDSRSSPLHMRGRTHAPIRMHTTYA